MLLTDALFVLISHIDPTAVTKSDSIDYYNLTQIILVAFQKIQFNKCNSVFVTEKIAAILIRLDV